MLAYAPQWGHKLATLTQPTGWVKGFTLRRIPAQVRFLPANPGAGLRVQLLVGPENAPEPFGGIIPVNLATVRAGQYSTQLGTLPMGWSELTDADYGIGVCEHLLGACVIAGLTDALIQVYYPDRWQPPFVPVPLRNGPQVASLPLLDGSAAYYLNAIQQAGGVQWHAMAEPLRPRLTKHECYSPNSKSLMQVMVRTQPGWSLSLSQNNPPEHQAPWWKNQQTSLTIDSTAGDFDQMLAYAGISRPTNSSMGKFWLYRLVAFGTDQDGGFAVVHNKDGTLRLKGQPAYADDEAVYHRWLDVAGDLLAPLGAFQADIHIHYASHAAMGFFRRWLLQERVFV